MKKNKEVGGRYYFFCGCDNLKCTQLKEYAIYYYSDDANIKSSINVDGVTIVTDNAVIFLESEATMFLVEIYNMTGQKVFQTASLDNTVSISKTNFVSGIYLIKLFTEKGIIVEKIII